ADRPRPWQAATPSLGELSFRGRSFLVECVLLLVSVEADNGSLPQFFPILADDFFHLHFGDRLGGLGTASPAADQQAENQKHTAAYPSAHICLPHRVGLRFLVVALVRRLIPAYRGRPARPSCRPTSERPCSPHTLGRSRQGSRRICRRSGWNA